jgi:hypothetical protein
MMRGCSPRASPSHRPPAAPLFAPVSFPAACAAAAAAASALLQVKKRNLMPGEGMGLPMYHALSGNLPVLTHKFHHSPSAQAGVTGGPSAYQQLSGNLPVLSRELAKKGADELMPGWVPLIDPQTKAVFWWNIYYKSRRPARPATNDDGRRGAGKGESNAGARTAKRRAAKQAMSEAKTWEERYDVENSARYYVSRKLGVSTWTQPDDFAADGIPYKPKWREGVDAATGDTAYTCIATGVVTSDLPDDFDGVPVAAAWVEHMDPASGYPYYENSISGEKTWEKPASFGSVTTPTDPPPPCPADDGDLDLYVEDDDEEDVAVSLAGGDPDAVDDTVIFPDYVGYLRKRGGGYSFMGRKSWKERFVVLRGGVLTYFKSRADWEADREPVKGLRINMRNYGVAR